MTRNQVIKLSIVVTALTVTLTTFFYVHESFPRPLRAITALLGTPTAIASGISHYLNFGIPVYETPWAIVLANLIASILIVAIFIKLRKLLLKKKNRS